MNAGRIPPDGLLVVDKPAGWTSHDVVARVRRLSGERRVGHAGTLDPLATGVLVLGVGQGTRVLAYLGDAGKTYQARVRLGVSTDTYDAEGQVTAQTSTGGISAEHVEAALAPFRGTFEQRPPVYSALKRAGRPLYSYARAGVEIEAPARTVHVETLTLLGFDPPDVDLEIVCSSGFYVRSLAHDLGQRLSCGAHLLALQRTRVDAFTIEQATTIEALERAAAEGSLATRLLPLDAALSSLPAIVLDASQERSIVQGQEITLGRPAVGSEHEPPAKRLTLRQAQGERGPAQAEQGTVSPRSTSRQVRATAYRAYAPDGSLAAIISVSADGLARPLRVFPRGRRGPISDATDATALQ